MLFHVGIIGMKLLLDLSGVPGKYSCYKLTFIGVGLYLRVRRKTLFRGEQCIGLPGVPKAVFQRLGEYRVDQGEFFWGSNIPHYNDGIAKGDRKNTGENIVHGIPVQRVFFCIQNNNGMVIPNKKGKGLKAQKMLDQTAKNQLLIGTVRADQGQCIGRGKELQAYFAGLFCKVGIGNLILQKPGEQGALNQMAVFFIDIFELRNFMGAGLGRLYFFFDFNHRFQDLFAVCTL